MASVHRKSKDNRPDACEVHSHSGTANLETQINQPASKCSKSIFIVEKSPSATVQIQPFASEPNTAHSSHLPQRLFSYPGCSFEQPVVPHFSPKGELLAPASVSEHKQHRSPVCVDYLATLPRTTHQREQSNGVEPIAHPPLFEWTHREEKFIFNENARAGGNVAFHAPGQFTQGNSRGSESDFTEFGPLPVPSTSHSVSSLDKAQRAPNDSNGTNATIKNAGGAPKRQQTHESTGLKLRLNLRGLKSRGGLYRTCLVKGCNSRLPSKDIYPYQRCAACRRGAKNLRVRFDVLARSPTPSSVDHVDFLASEGDIGVFSRDGNSEIESEWRLSGARHRYQAEQYTQEKKTKRATADPRADRQQWQKILNFRAPPSEYPRYLRLVDLLLGIKVFTRDFLRAQSLYLVHLLQTGRKSLSPVHIAIFAFDGEFSVVVQNDDLESKKNSVETDIANMKKAVENDIGIHFSYSPSVSVSGGTVAQFRCTHEISLFEVEKQSRMGQLTPSAHKTMSGVLEIAVLPDRSHRCLSAQRTVVRLRLIG